MVDRWVLPDATEAPAIARQIVGGLCDQGALSPARASDVTLLVSELVTNAVKHGRGEIQLAFVRPSAGAVRFEVRDAGAVDRPLEAPRPRHRDDTHQSGRGFLILETIAKRWGFDTTGVETCAWFEL